MRTIAALLQAIGHSGATLTLIAFGTTALVAGTYLKTYKRIDEQHQIARFKALHQILPNLSPDISLDKHTLIIADTMLGYQDKKTVYQIVADGQVRAIALTVIAPDGYTGEIELLLALSPEGQVYGVRTISHRETPGLGDKIELRKSNWIEGFAGRSLTNPIESEWDVKRHGGYFDQFTGATVTPRAVVRALSNALKYVRQNRAQLFKITDSSSRLHES
jgi:electron transport complex protein RnfG